MRERIERMYDAYFPERKRLSYRDIWAQRHQMTPSGKRTWGEWWNACYGRGQTIEEYHEERRKLANEAQSNQDAKR